MTTLLKWLNNPYVLGALVVIGSATDLKLSSIKPWGISDLVPLIPLPKNTAAKLAQAADNLDSMGIQLSRATANYRELNSDERQNFAKFQKPGAFAVARREL
jgi:hypothetical protein